MLNLIENGQFKDGLAAERAVHLLQFLVNAQTDTPEYQLPLNKLLCGVHGRVPLARTIEITDHERATIEQLLQGMIAHWAALGNTSIAGLRQTFLQRQGVLCQRDDAWHLKVVPATFDMLLDRLPWAYSLIRLPWMTAPLHVSWR